MVSQTICQIRTLLYWGGVSNRIRIFLCKRIFKECGKVSTINRNIYFGNGKDIVIGDYSGIGANCSIPNDIHIGKYVMMGPFLYCITFGHEVSDTSTPMCSKVTWKKPRTRTSS